MDILVRLAPLVPDIQPKNCWTYFVEQVLVPARCLVEFYVFRGLLYKRRLALAYALFVEAYMRAWHVRALLGVRPIVRIHYGI